jgi:hypothetical protein
MEDNGATAAAAPVTSMPAAEKRVAIIPDAAAEAKVEGEGDAPAAALLPCGPRKTGLHLFVMNIRCAFFVVVLARAQLHCTVTIADENMLVCGGENRSVFKLDGLGSEVLRIAVPASLALAADPLASLVDTAFIGRLGK